MSRRFNLHCDRGFTLLELLLTVAVLAVLLLLLLSSLQSVRAAARQAACASNLRQLGIATQGYLNENDDRFWRYYWTRPSGRLWWFGFEPGGPRTGTYRPLDAGSSPLARFARNWADDGMLCPDFPYDDGGFYPKFARPAASYGYNLHLGPTNIRFRPVSRLQLDNPGAVFVFADGIHFDFGSGFNEGHYIQRQANTAIRSGYAHFRHSGQAQAVFGDAHVEVQTFLGSAHRTVAGGAAGNLAGRSGPSDTSIYGLP